MWDRLEAVAKVREQRLNTADARRTHIKVRDVVALLSIVDSVPLADAWFAPRTWGLIRNASNHIAHELFRSFTL